MSDTTGATQAKDFTSYGCPHCGLTFASNAEAATAHVQVCTGNPDQFIQDRERITYGDTVGVAFDHHPPIFGALVVGCPQDTGDSWKLRESDGHLLYVQNFATMRRVG